MYLRRKIDDFLTAWKADPDRMPLIVKGARQIGKTESICRFAAASYESVIYINFALDRRYDGILRDGYTVDAVVGALSMVEPSFRFIPGKTVFIFDELQALPDIATTLKSFKIDGRYDVICSGSTLGINYKKIHSNSVGYKTDYEMYSMDFEEFLWAKGYRTDQIDEIFCHMKEFRPLGQTAMDVFRHLFLDYCVLGGMPAVVASYIENRNFSGTLAIQRQIQLDYEEDIRKYAEGLDQAKIVSVYRSVPAQLAKENKKFSYAVLGKNARGREYAGCIDWLVDAGVVSVCRCLNFPELPLKGNVDDSKFKLYYPDTGLLVASLDDEAQEDLRANRNLGVYKGALFENFIAEAFLKQGLGLYYYKKENSTLEEDFFVRTTDELIPIEVKAGRNRSKSLSTLMGSDRYADIRHGIKLGDFNIGYADSICTFPNFCAFLLKRFLREKPPVEWHAVR